VTDNPNSQPAPSALPAETADQLPPKDPMIETPQLHVEPSTSENFDIRFIYHALLRGWWLIVLAALAGGWFGAQNLLNFGPVYVASMSVASGESRATSPNAALRSFGEGLGLNFDTATGGGPATSFDRLKVTISSLEFVRHLEDKYDIIHKVFAGAWDSESNSWIRPTGRRFEFRQGLNAKLHLPLWSEPTTQSFAEFLSGTIIVRDSIDSPFTTVSTRSADPEFALWLLETVYMEADAFVREADLRATRERKSYLEGQIDQTNILEFRQMFVSLLANEERRLMLTQTDLPYAAQIIRSPFVSSRPTSPNVVEEFWVQVFGWMLAGALFILLFALVRSQPSTA